MFIHIGICNLLCDLFYAKQRARHTFVPLQEVIQSDGMLTEQEQNNTERIENGYGMDTEQILTILSFQGNK